MKTLILDTNVLLTDPDSLYAFEENEIILPFTTIEELDKIKSRTNEVGANAREVARRLSEMISENEQGALKRGVKLPSGGILRLVAVSDFIFDEDEKFGKDWDPTNKDNHILDVCRGLTKQHREEGKPDPVLISRDILLRVKCDFLGIPCEDYKNSHITDNVDSIYTGSTLLDVEEDVIQEFWECSQDITRDFYLKLDPEFEQELVPNQFLLLQDPNSEDEQAVRYSDSGEPLKIVHDIKSPVYGLLPRNKEQNLAMDLLLDQDIKLVTLLGLAGCGKTLLALAAGLNQVIEKKRYKRLFICRPIVPVGNDIGFLPGEKSEKLEPWIAPIKDNLRYLLFSGTAGRKSRQNEMTFNNFFEDGLIEIEAITYLRGRSIADAYIIIDEAQNLTAHELKTIITRVGENTKIVLTGDIDQIDNMYIDAKSNGLTIAVEKFKKHKIAGHIKLVKGERSELATLASSLL
jgi:PhoH-like ATPase